MLSDEDINIVVEIKNVLKEVIFSNHGNYIETTLSIFREVINREYNDRGAIIKNIQLTNDDKIQVALEINNSVVEFEADINISLHDGELEKLLEYCEPWRKTHPDLVESERKLKEWANIHEQ
jgi:hypothetical protein